MTQKIFPYRSTVAARVEDIFEGATVNPFPKDGYVTLRASISAAGTMTAELDSVTILDEADIRIASVYPVTKNALLFRRFVRAGQRLRVSATPSGTTSLNAVLVFEPAGESLPRTRNDG